MADDPAPLDGLRLLVVEDNLIIAMDAEQILLDGGAAEVFTASNVAAARDLVARERLDAAVLDVNLGAETSFALLPDLLARRVAFVFVTGYGESADLPAEARGAEAVRKPFAAESLWAAVGRAAGR